MTWHGAASFFFCVAGTAGEGRGGRALASDDDCPGRLVLPAWLCLVLPRPGSSGMFCTFLRRPSCIAQPVLPVPGLIANPQHPISNIQSNIQFQYPTTLYILGTERTSKPCPRRREKASSCNAKTEVSSERRNNPRDALTRLVAVFVRVPVDCP